MSCVFNYKEKRTVMCKFIGVEILAANALIEALESEKTSTITFSKLEEYGLKVVEFLETTYNEQAVIIYNENQTTKTSKIIFNRRIWSK